MNFTKFLILAFFNVGIFCCLIFPVQASEIIWHGNETITQPTIWRDGEVHIISDRVNFDVMPTGSLTLEAGTIVKVGFNSYIRIYGNFKIDGTAEKPVYIVSARDDSIAGDTNGDGSATSVDYGDWRGIMFDGSRYKSLVNVDINYANIYHGGGGHSTYSIGRGCLFSAFGVESFKVNNSNLINNKGSIFTDAHSRNVSINNSNLYRDDCDYQNATDGCQYSLYYLSVSKDPVDITNNYWGSPNGPTYITGADPEFYNGVVVANLMGNVTYLPFIGGPIEIEVEEKKLNPVIVVPGLMGSWQDFKGEWQIDPILKTYDDLLSALRLAGYRDNETLFTFPYQWRQSNIITASELRNKINQAKEACVGENFDCSKVDLVTHSMGGLVARQYVASSNYQDDIDQLIFIATPHKGAPKAYLMWEGGELEPKLREKPLELILKSEAKKNGYKGTGAISNYIRNNNLLSTAELLPIYNYLFDNNFDLNNLRTYPNQYPRNLFLENLNSQSNLDKLAKIKILNITARTEGMDTLNALAVVASERENLWPNGMPYNFYGIFGEKGLFYGLGDQTVPSLSNNNFLNLNSLLIDGDHGGVVSLAQKAVIKELTGQEPDYEVNNSYFPNILLIIMNSPADFMVTDPLGRRIGRDLADLKDLKAITEIPEAFFSGYGEDSQAEFVAIINPITGDYQVEVLGTEAGGAYNLNWNYLNKETEIISSLDYDDYILNNQKKELKINLDQETEPVLTEPTINIFTAISDLDLLFERGLITNKVSKLKLLAFYQLLKIRVEVLDRLIEKFAQVDLKLKGRTINFDRQLLKAQTERQELIRRSLTDFNQELDKLLAKGYLKQLGYDIIKRNNNYLIINW